MVSTSFVQMQLKDVFTLVKWHMITYIYMYNEHKDVLLLTAI